MKWGKTKDGSAVTNNWSPVSVGSVAVEVYVYGLHLPHVAEPKVDAVSGKTQCCKIQMGTERHCLNRVHKMKLTFWGVKSCNYLQIITQRYLIFSFYTFISTVADLQAVVAVVNQEVLLEPQLPLPTCTADQRHPMRNVLIYMQVCMVQKGQRAVKGHFHLAFKR